MSKKRVVTCPDCALSFTVPIGGQQVQTIGVRSRQVTGNQVEYTITTPEGVVESGRVSTATSDALFIGFFSLCLGALAGGICNSLLTGHLPNNAVIEATAQTAIVWASGGGVIGYGWLCAEHNQRLKSVLPKFIEQKKAWASARDETISGNVSLTMDHRYRDGNTEAGRTIQYFGELPVDVERFNQWAEAVLGTRVPAQTLAHAAWSPLAKGKLFSRTEYEPLLAHMVNCGTVVNQPGKGHILTGGGRRALHQHLKAHPPTGWECA